MAAWTQWLVPIVAIVIYALGFLVVWRRLRRIKDLNALEGHVRQIETEQRTVNASTVKWLEELQERTMAIRDSLGEFARGESLTRVEGRLDYIEKKVGSELFDVLMDQILATKGFKRGNIVYRIVPIAARQPVTKQEEMRLAQARELLGEAATIARSASEPGNDFDKMTNQGWFAMQMQRFISDFFFFRSI